MASASASIASAQARRRSASVRRFSNWQANVFNLWGVVFAGGTHPTVHAFGHGVPAVCLGLVRAIFPAQAQDGPVFAVAEGPLSGVRGVSVLTMEEIGCKVFIESSFSGEEGFSRDRSGARNVCPVFFFATPLLYMKCRKMSSVFDTSFTIFPKLD